MLLPSELSKVFPVYSSFNTSGGQAWIVSNRNTDSIHRFFDSSPFSPSNRYIAFTEISLDDTLSQKSREKRYSDYATVVMVDLRSGLRTEVGRTLAWDSQVGAHVQWGDSDQHLFYNSFGEGLQYENRYYCYWTPPINESSSSSSWFLPIGVMYDTYTGKKNINHCPIYHVSPDGKNTASPNLFKIAQTQKGYGIPLDQIMRRQNTSVSQQAVVDTLMEPYKTPVHSDGLFLCHSSYCRKVVSLSQLAAVAGFDKTRTPMYGFHTKWSPDGRLVMFVVRTLEQPVPSSSNTWLSTFSSPADKEVKLVRVQHLFVILPHTPILKHVISWASRPFVSAVTGKVVYLRDGNHPNWIPCTTGIKDVGHEGPIHFKTCSSYKISMNLLGRNSKSKDLLHYELVEFDVTRYFPTLGTEDRVDSTVVGVRVAPNTTLVREIMKPRYVYHLGTGHPTHYYSREELDAGRYVVMDAYEKEKELLVQHIKQGLKMQLAPDGKSGEMPLRLIDLKLKKETTLLTMNIVRQKSISQRVSEQVSALFGGRHNKKDSSWRCDMHPAWSRDFRWLAVNGVPHGDNRQVIIVYMGNDVSNLF